MENARLVLSQRPDGIPGPEHFEPAILPARAPDEGEVLLETLLVSLDPAMRTWMSERPGHFDPIPLGEVMRAGGIGRVLKSRANELHPGDLVQGRTGWQSHPTVPGRYLQKLDLALGDPLDWIGPLGGTALTAYCGMKLVGDLRDGDRVLVSAAAGGVGQIAAQIAKIEGCRVVGIAGGAEKCAFLADELGLDAAIDHRRESDIAAAIASACPKGVDLYFDNVGGPTLDAALLHANSGGRIVACGRISEATADVPYGIKNFGQAIGKGLRIQGFLIREFSRHFPTARRWLAARVREGSLTQRLHVLEGLESAPAGLGMLFRGENTGKLVVRIAR